MVVVREMMKPMIATTGPMMVCIQRSEVLAACQELIIDIMAARAALEDQQMDRRENLRWGSEEQGDNVPVPQGWMSQLVLGT